MEFTSKPASDYPLPNLVETLNRGFEGYFVPITLNLTAFLNMVRKDGIDLSASRMLLAGDAPVGIALIARRGWTSRLAAMGVAPEARGIGAGSWLMKQLIDEACERGEREMVLEVIEQNEPAVHLYEKYGFQRIRRLIGFLRKDAVEQGASQLEEIDLREAARLITQYGLPDLPWQLSGESIAQLNPPARAYSDRSAHIVVSDLDAHDVVIWSLLAEPQARGNGSGTQMLRSMMALFPAKTWHFPALLPEELGASFERAGFVKDHLMQWQMSLSLTDARS